MKAGVDRRAAWLEVFAWSRKELGPRRTSLLFGERARRLTRGGAHGGGRTAGDTRAPFLAVSCAHPRFHARSQPFVDCISFSISFSSLLSRLLTFRSLTSARLLPSAGPT